MAEQLSLFEEENPQDPPSVGGVALHAALGAQREYPLPERPPSNAATEQGWDRGGSVRTSAPVEVSLAQESSDKQWHPPTAEERSIAKQKIAEVRRILARS